MTLQLDHAELPPGERGELRFQIIAADGKPVRGYEVEHEKRMHLIVVRNDLTGFQHLHPKLGADGTLAHAGDDRGAGSYRVFADFKRRGEPTRHWPPT